MLPLTTASNPCEDHSEEEVWNDHIRQKELCQEARPILPQVIEKLADQGQEIHAQGIWSHDQKRHEVEDPAPQEVPAQVS